MSGQIVDATIVATPKQRNTIEDRRLREQACEARAERPGCALDGQILRGEAA
jgi:hypothetical protein